MFIIANILSFIGSVFMVISGYIKETKKFLIIQSTQILFMGIGNLLLGGVTGFIVNIVSIIRNLICSKGKLDTKARWIIVGINAAICLYFNNLGIVGLLPIISTSIFTLFMDFDDDKKNKVLVFGTVIIWLVYDWCIKNYVSFTFDALTIISSSIALIKMRIPMTEKTIEKSSGE